MTGREAWIVSGALAAALALEACSDVEVPPAMGTLERDRLELVAELAEPVILRPVEEGDYVESGTLIVRLDPKRQAARVAQARGARERAKARVAELVRGPREEKIDEARARVAGAEGRFETVERELERTRQLFAQRVVSREQLDQREASFDEARAARDAARATLEALLDGTTEEELAQAQATLAEADAALAEAEVRLERLDVRAPAAGWIEALPYEPGEEPPPGGVVAALLEDERPYARIYVPAAVRTRVTAGTLARVRVDGVEGTLPGRVRTVAREAAFTPYFALTERDRGRLVYLAKVDLLDPETRRLPTGVPVEVEFETEPPLAAARDER